MDGNFESAALKRNQRMWKPSNTKSFNTNVEMRRLATPAHRNKCNSDYWWRENRLSEAKEMDRKLDLLNGCHTICNTTRTMQPVELLVTNLDAYMNQICLKRELLHCFQENQVQVLNVSLVKSQHTANSHSWREYELSSYSAIKAIVKVATFQDAQIAVSKLHHSKLGAKRIMVSILSKDRSPPYNMLKREVISIFDEIPSKKLPLVTFQDLYEKRNHRSLSMNDVHRLREVIQITSECDNGGKFVVMNPHQKLSSAVEISGEQRFINANYCKLHSKIVANDIWLEQESICLPNVRMSLKMLAPRIHRLLDTHEGSLPLASIIDCYQSEFKSEFEYGEPSVPLEHLISCVPGVEVTSARSIALKRIQWIENKFEDSKTIELHPDLSQSSSASDAIAKHLNQFSREVKDLLKNQSHCLMSFSKFVPAYHNHFGRQCCVYQYGYTKLIDLLEATSHVVQILGDGNKRVLTLTHREQTKRFATDLLKVLKVQPGKRLTLTQFPELFASVLEKPFSITDYGVCYLTDILEDLWEGTAVMKEEGNEIVVEIPKRERTENEKKRTKLFANNVIELLESTPNFSMSFCKFIPAFHHYFGRQCKVSDYGFTKLMELLEEITPDVIELIVLANGEDKIIRLNLENRLIAMRNRLVRIVRTHSNGCLPLSKLHELFRHEFGFNINVVDYNAADMSSLIMQMPASFRLVSGDGEPTLKTVSDCLSNMIRRRIIRILMEEADSEMQTETLISFYKEKFDEELDLFVLHKRMKDCVLISTKLRTVSLSDTLKLVRNCILVLQQMTCATVTVRSFCRLYEKMFRKPLPNLRESRHRNLIGWFHSQSDFLTVRRTEELVWFLSVNSDFIDEKLVIRSRCVQEKNVRKASEDGEKATNNICLSENDGVEGCSEVFESQECSNGSKVPFPPNEWLAEKKEVNTQRRRRRIVAKFDLTTKDDE